MSHEEISESLGAFALDAVDPDEAAVIAQHLEECPACAAEVAEHQRVAALLGNTSEDAPVYLWERIAGPLGDHPGEDHGRAPRLVPGAVGGPAAAPVRGRLGQLARRPWPLATAAAVVAIALLSLQIARLDNRSPQLSANGSLAQLAQAAMRSPGTRTVGLAATGASHAVEADVVVESSGTGYVVDKSLPTLPRTETYQLWGRSGSRLVSLGLLGAHPGTVAVGTSGPRAYGAFLITVEPSGGVPQPTAAPVASSLA